jgi:hypothetical protein
MLPPVFAVPVIVIFSPDPALILPVRHALHAPPGLCTTLVTAVANLPVALAHAAREERLSTHAASPNANRVSFVIVQASSGTPLLQTSR